MKLEKVNIIDKMIKKTITAFIAILLLLWFFLSIKDYFPIFGEELGVLPFISIMVLYILIMTTTIKWITE